MIAGKLHYATQLNASRPNLAVACDNEFPTTVDGATAIHWKLGQYQGRVNRWIEPFSRRFELKQR